MGNDISDRGRSHAWWLVLLLLLFLSGPGQALPAGPLVLGPLVQLTETGTLRLVWWTDRPGNARIRLETMPPTEVEAQSHERRVSAPPPLDRTWQHVATLPDLLPAQPIPYRLFLDDVDLSPTQPFTLRVPPATPPLRIAVIGDYGAGTSWARQVHDVIAAWQPDLILTAGDNAYGRGRYEEFRTRVFALYGDLMAQIPFMPAIGNHDNATDHAAPYLDLFVLPENAWRAGDRERYYSFDVANAHIVMLDSTDGLAGISAAAQDDMADWLAADLEATEKFWRIAAFHHPPYSAGAHGSNTAARQRLVPRLEAGGVQWVFNGHEHDYQRTCPVRDGACVSPSDGVIYIITGGGGAWLRPTGTAWFTRHAESVHEAAFLTLGTCLATLTVLDREGRTVDRATVDRCRSYYFPRLLQRAFSRPPPGSACRR